MVDKKIEKINFKILPEANEEYISVTYGCIRFMDSRRFLSSSLDSLVKTLVDNSYKTLKGLEEAIVDNDEKLNFVNEIKIIIKEDKCTNDSINDLKRLSRSNYENRRNFIFLYR